jgi:hypothetical protein
MLPFFLWVALLFLMGSSERWWRTGKRSPWGRLKPHGLPLPRPNRARDRADDACHELAARRGPRGRGSHVLWSIREKSRCKAYGKVVAGNAAPKPFDLTSEKSDSR